MYRAGGAPERPAEPAADAYEGLGASTMPQSVMPVPSQFGQSLGDTQARDSLIDSIDLDLDNPEIGSPSRPAPLDSLSPSLAEPARHDPTTVKMPLVAEDSVTRPDRRDEPLAFDLSGITLDLDQPTQPPESPATAAGDLSDGTLDPLARKLELAEEFQRIGDKDGARDLLREVLATASGATKTKAQGMLDSIS